MVLKIMYNWFYSTECGEDYNIYEVGQSYTLGKVSKIENTLPHGKGDKPHCVVYFENGNTETIYNINTITEINT